jgi:hypothetical protein
MSRDNVQKITADLSQLPEPFPGHAANRVETGALEINDDWPGVFIRGDNAMHYAVCLKQLLAKLESQIDQNNVVDIVYLSAVHSLVKLLDSSRI